METNNKRIAKNTLLLYFRMLLTMFVSLYSVRVVLEKLGLIDYGIYNIVGSIVTMFSFLSVTMSSASQRFFSVELGKGDYIQLKKTFSVTLIIYILMAGVIMLLAETIGLWFLKYKINIPLERKDTANWVYQFSILSFVVSMLTIPYNALMVSYERMSLHAFISILEALLKLIVIYTLVIFPFDKLKLYSILTFITTIIIAIVFRKCCQKSFFESRFSLIWDKKLFKEIASYSGWNLFGAIAGVFSNQGIGLVLNLFFGPVVNTAQGIAYQINGSINQFAINFMTATKPQITKLYANNEYDKMIHLIFKTTKISFYLLFLIAIPIYYETNFILTIWLKTVPEYLMIFTRLIIIISLIDTLSYSTMSAIQATGNVRNYQLIVGFCFMLNLPITFGLFKLGFSAHSAFIVGICNAVVCLFLRIVLLKRAINFSMNEIFQSVIRPILSTVLFSSVINIVIFRNNTLVFSVFFVKLCVFYIITFIIIYSLGLDENDKRFLRNFLRKRKYEQEKTFNNISA